jgi:hypothetical protein
MDPSLARSAVNNAKRAFGLREITKRSIKQLIKIRLN